MGGSVFLDWKEEFVSQERGNRVVHYYLKESSGDAILAVVGTERSVRHMVYVVADDFLHFSGSQTFINPGFKWRSRREVVDWLTSLLSSTTITTTTAAAAAAATTIKSPKNDSPYSLGSAEYVLNGRDVPGGHLSDDMTQVARRLKGHNSDIFWSGDSWTCGKQLKHYSAFWRNGITIAIHSFVFVMGKEENHYLAYLEDMYEDRKGLKKVRARWFHDHQEVERVIILPNARLGEVFITPHSQVISAECVDGPATVLTPDHYEKCLAISPNMTSARISVCSRQFKSNRIMPFDLSKLRGYFEQAILSCLEEVEEFNQRGNKKMGSKKTRSCRGRQRFVANHSGNRMSGEETQLTECIPKYHNLRFGLSGRKPPTVKYVGFEPSVSLPFKVGEKIEFLCQDSGIRGCWFRCTILEVCRKKVKVQYDDLRDPDGCGNLEEWLPAVRLANPDKLGMRCAGRLTIRPCPLHQDLTDGVLEIGSPVDAQWHDGWWEGVITEMDNCGNDNIQVYFPGESVFSTFKRRNLRMSRDWVKDRWVDLEVKPEILSTIAAAVSPGRKLSSCSTIAKGTESGSSAMSEREVPIPLKLDTVEEDKQELICSPLSNDIPNKQSQVENNDNDLKEDKKGAGDTDGKEETRDVEENIEASGHTPATDFMEVAASMC